MNLIDMESHERRAFWEKVDRKSIEECWLWKGSVTTNGYGQITYRCKTYRAHRFMYEMIHGDIGSVEIHVCHKCDNKLCVNLSHLFLGTYQDNMTDKVIKKRQSSTLSEDNIKELVETYNTGMTTQKRLAKRYGITQSQVSRILSGIHWKHKTHFIGTDIAIR